MSYPRNKFYDTFEVVEAKLELYIASRDKTVVDDNLEIVS
jgi:hypothetical protein